MSEEKLISRIAVAEQRVDGLENKVEKLESTSEALIELKTIVKMQSAFQERMHNEHTAQMGRFEITINKVNDNLTLLNSSTERLNTSQEQLKNEMGTIGSRVKDIEDSREDGKIDITKALVKVVMACFMIIPTAISAWILIKLGLK